MGLLASISAGAQVAAEDPATIETTILQTAAIDTVIIEAEANRIQALALPRLTQPLIETPQSITAISAQELADRAVSSLDDALRNVPGISLGAGEFSWQGNAPTIRGFVARGDMFLDGVRDFGNYYRDAFNLQQIEVLQGPSSIFFGRGSTGGVINQASKQPTLTPAIQLGLAGGTDSNGRATIDINRPIDSGLGEGAALRLTAMANTAKVPGRDVAEANRYGVAPSLALGLGTPTRITANYFHQTEDNTPDYGLPWYFERPAPVPRKNFYGFEDDFLHTDANILTFRVEHDLNPRVTIREQVRYAHYGRDFRITEAVLAAGTLRTDPLPSVMISRNVWSGNSVETTLQSQTEMVAEFDTGSLNHAVVAGFDLGRETSAPLFENSLGVPNESLLSPNPKLPFSATSVFPRLKADTTAESYALYAVDTIALSERWEFTGGLRWDYFSADFSSISGAPDGTISDTADIVRTDRMPSWRTALVYKFAPNGTIYVSSGTSFNPSAESLTQITSGRAFGTENSNLEPEENISYEIGSKWDVLDGNLSLTAAAFRLEKKNARVPDPDNPGFNTLGGKHRVDGFQAQAIGDLTDTWLISAGYTYLDSEIVTAAPGAASIGQPLINTPKHSISLLSRWMLPGDVQVGVGAQYQSARQANNAAVPRVAPSYWTFDALAKVNVNAHMALQLNVYNLTDEYYFSALHPWHVVPGAGRSALLTLNFFY